MNEFNRLELMLGKEALEKIKQSNVIIFGVGGVGGYVAEALVRSGIGKLTVVDGDVVDITNINRQIIALHSTVGKSKAEVFKSRALDINPEVEIEAITKFYKEENQNEFDLSKYDYIVDAIDMMSSKILLIENATKNNLRIISALGAGNKLDPTKLEVSDIYKTSVDPLAKILRHELRNRNIKHLKVVYSKEEPLKTKSRTPGSTSFVPSTMGLVIASEVIKDILNN